MKYAIIGMIILLLLVSGCQKAPIDTYKPGAEILVCQQLCLDKDMSYVSSNATPDTFTCQCSQIIFRGETK